jgi:8-oxo-dGTP pyrophosphatase MutT (NUDIX family)
MSRVHPYQPGAVRLESVCLDRPQCERAVVLGADGVLTVRDPVGVHILPGGRRQAGETFERTVRREVMEETGWVIGRARLLGVKHFRHLSPRPVDYRYPYPDFFQAVYAAQAHRFDPGGREKDGYELGAEFQPIAKLQRVPLPPSERLFLAAATAHPS